MPELTQQHIQQIRHDLEYSGIKQNLLKHELLDHICCQVESEMENGLDFQNAYRKISGIHTQKEISRTRRNVSFFINYRSFVTAGLLYLSIVAYLASWLVHINAADWLGLLSFLLISIVFLRYSVIFNQDANLKNHNLLSVLSGIVFVFFLTGSIFRFLWLSYGLSNPHTMPMLIFSWLLLTIIAIIYYKHVYQKYKHPRHKRFIMLFRVMAYVHLLLALFSMSTLFFKSLQQFIPLLAGVIIGIDLIFFLAVVFIKQKGKGVIKSLLISSFVMVFVYFPLKSTTQPEVYSLQFKAVSQQNLNTDKLYLHANYFKYGKETLVMSRKNDSVYTTKPIPIPGGNIEIACKVTSKREDTHKVLYDNDIKENRFYMNRNDTLFTIQYEP
jgi:hypothetical protein